jgi:hypothetical protein
MYSINVHGFIRGRDGHIRVVDGPQAIGTFPERVNASGEMVGSYLDSTSVHGFFLGRDGKFIPLTFPGATSTDAKAINAEGMITGNYSGANGRPHGFVLFRNCRRCDLR